ncbi:MAG: rod shape-determining protein RodA [Clostridiales bacterium]|jgi:rod shape determining protein RodA|nr:rod shape-determining protein RodA [Clostridiales bacterium]
MLKRSLASFDILLALAVCGLCVFGIIMVGSATNINDPATTSTMYDMQKVWFAIGLVLMLAAALIDYHFICGFYIIIYLVNIILLVLVLFVGAEGDDPSRWIRFGTTGLAARFGIQPSEFSKVFMILFLSKFLEKRNVNKVLVLLCAIISVALPVALIQMQPSLSAMMIVAFIGILIIYEAGLHYRYVVIALLLVAPAAVFLYIDLNKAQHIIVDKILSDYQITRILDFFNPDESTATAFHLQRSISAIGSGMLRGKGLYNGIVAVPAAYTDFIFAVIGEEFGFVGCITVMAVMLFIIFKCVVTAYKAPDLLGKLIAAGVAGMIAFQTFAHIGVDIGLLPNTGVPLPFISYGGSSMWINMVSVGLVLNVAMTKQKSIFEV